jgi:trimeric autotransporter adhesin
MSMKVSSLLVVLIAFSATPAFALNTMVGIGTTTPAQMLHVARSTVGGNSYLGFFENSSGSGAALVEFQGGGAGKATQMGTTSAGDFVLATNTTEGTYSNERLRVTAAGNVGVGTTTPSARFDLFDGTGHVTFGSAQSGSGYTLYQWADATGGHIQSANLGTGWSNLMLNQNGGSVGIGITSPSYTLHVVGTAGLSTGTAWTNASDIRLKDLHGDYEYGLDEVLKLHTVRFTYKKDNPLGLPSDHPMTGFIAQEVEKVIPDAVHENKNGYLELNVDPIHWAVVNAVKELKALIDGIYERLAGHDQAIADLIAKDSAKDRDIASVKAENSAIKAKDEAKDQKIKQLEQENAAIKAYLCGKDPSAAICQ